MALIAEQYKQVFSSYGSLHKYVKGFCTLNQKLIYRVDFVIIVKSQGKTLGTVLIFIRSATE